MTAPKKKTRAARVSPQGLPDNLLLTKEEQLELSNIQLQRHMVRTQIEQAQTLARQAEDRLLQAQGAWLTSLGARLKMDPALLATRYVMEQDGKVRLMSPAELDAAKGKSA